MGAVFTSAARAQTTQAQAAADWDHTDPGTLADHPSAPLPGYQIIEITITGDSAGAGKKLKPSSSTSGCSLISCASWGNDHPVTLYTRANRARAIDGQGRHQEAERLLRELITQQHQDMVSQRNRIKMIKD